MNKNLNHVIDQLIKSYLSSSYIWPQLEETILNAINVDQIGSSEFGSPKQWSQFLPVWCCEAAGGRGELTDITSAAWKLFHIAAHTLDNVADRDPPQNWWKDLGPGVAINTATSLIFAAEALLLHQFENPSRYPFGLKIFREFKRSLEIICSGQHMDLVQAEPSTDSWLKIAGAKSGEPFALACKVGAIIGTDEEDRIKAFAKFGHHLGVIIQIQDDVHDFIHEDLMVGKNPKDLKTSSFPISYALEVLPEREKKYLRGLLSALASEPGAKEKVIAIVEKTGAIVFIETKKDLNKTHAMDALDKAAKDNASKQKLLDLLDYLSAS